MRAPIMAVGGVVTAGLAGWTATGLAPHAPWLCGPLGIARRLDARATAAREIAITFDDGPHPEGTPAVLAALKQAGARATFFLVGEQVERHPELAAQIAAAGHGIGLHNHRHRNQMLVAPGALDDDLERALSAIEAATGREPAIYRPPFGIFTPAGLALARRRQLAAWLWSRWGVDWARRATPDSIRARVTAEAGPGDVLLLHDADWYSAPGSHRRTAAALPGILDELARRELVPALLPGA